MIRNEAPTPDSTAASSAVHSSSRSATLPASGVPGPPPGSPPPNAGGAQRAAAEAIGAAGAPAARPLPPAARGPPPGRCETGGSDRAPSPAQCTTRAPERRPATDRRWLRPRNVGHGPTSVRRSRSGATYPGVPATGSSSPAQMRNPEVHQPKSTVGAAEHVLRLHVEVEDPAGVGVSQGLQQVQDRLHPARGRGLGPERRTEPLHRDPAGARRQGTGVRRHPVVVDGDNRRVDQPGHGPHLAAEPPGVGVREALDRDGKLTDPGRPHRPAASSAEELGELEHGPWYHRWR